MDKMSNKGSMILLGSEFFLGAWQITKKKKAKQVSTMFGSALLGVILGAGVTVVNTRFLGPQQYGDLKFLQNIFILVATLLTGGVFVAGSRVLADGRYSFEKEEMIGSLFIVAGVVSFLLAGGMLCFSFYEQQIFHNELGAIIRICLPFLFIFPFRMCLEQIAQGDNRIYALSFFRAGPPLVYLLVALSVYHFASLTLVRALLIFFSVHALFTFALVCVLKPSFKRSKENILFLLRETKTYGFQVYLGILTGVASGYLGVVSVGYFVDNINVGFFSLAKALTLPLFLLPNAVAVSYYKDFAGEESIPKRVLWGAGALTLLAWLLFVTAIRHIVSFLYSDAYQAAVPFVYAMSVATVFHGFGDVFNRFLGAHGEGRLMRNGAFAVAISNIGGYVVLVLLFGVVGALATAILSAFVYFSMMLFSYQKCRRKVALDRAKND